MSDSRQEYHQRLVDLQQRNEEVDRRLVAVEQLNQEASDMYREALEHRIATEQLWQELQPLASQSRLSTRIADLRRQLEDHYQLTHQRLRARSEEVSDLIVRLEGHMHRLTRQREELEGWLT